MPLIPGCMAAGILLTVGALAAACRAPEPSADTPHEPGGAELRACELLTLADADPGGRLGLQAVQTPLDASEGTAAAKCSYATRVSPSQVVALEVRRYANASRAAAAQSAAASFLPSLSRTANEPVAGLGDEGLWAGGGLGQLHVRAGSLRLIVTVELGEEGSRREWAQALAARGLERLFTVRIH